MNRMEIKLFNVFLIKLGTNVAQEERINPIDFRCQSSKVKVKVGKRLYNLVNTINIKLLHVSAFLISVARNAAYDEWMNSIDFGGQLVKGHGHTLQ